MLVLDQFPRQIWRDTARAFAGDPQALALSLRAEAEGWIAAEDDQQRRAFWLMPRMHSEDLAVQEAALPLFERFTDPRTADFAHRHRDVIARFGRFPHRNGILGRESSPAERAFLLTPGSGSESLPAGGVGGGCPPVCHRLPGPVAFVEAEPATTARLKAVDPQHHASCSR